MSGDLIAEDHERRPVGRHCVIVEVTVDDLMQPFPLDWDRLMHAPAQCLLDRLELGPQPIASSLAFDQELASPGFAADEREAQEVEGLRLAKPAPSAARRRIPSELDQPGLVRMQ